jgi:hypothetical protein
VLKRGGVCCAYVVYFGFTSVSLDGQVFLSQSYEQGEGSVRSDMLTCMVVLQFDHSIYAFSSLQPHASYCPPATYCISTYPDLTLRKDSDVISKINVLDFFVASKDMQDQSLTHSPLTPSLEPLSPLGEISTQQSSSQFRTTYRSSHVQMHLPHMLTIVLNTVLNMPTYMKP